MDEGICPSCKSEETYMDFEHIYERGFAVRVCEDCGYQYRVIYRLEPIRIEELPTKKQ